MAAHNIDLHAVDTMLQNTLQLHRQLNRGHSGVTRPPNNPRQQQQHPPNSSGPSLGSSLRVENGSRSIYNSGTSSSPLTMDRTFSESSSSGMGSSGPSTVIASPPNSTAPGRTSHAISPSSPVTSTFSSPQIPRLPSSATFASYNDRPQRLDSQPASAHPSSTPSKDLPILSVDTAALPPSTSVSTATPNATPYTRSYTKSLSAGTQSLSYPSPQPHTRRFKTSLGGMANIDHNGRLVHHLLAGHDSKDGAATIFVNVRDVAKDQWVRLEIPRNIPVQNARDLILARCQRTMSPPSAPSSVAETLQVDDEVSVIHKLEARLGQTAEPVLIESTNNRDRDPSKISTHRSKGNNKSVPYNSIAASHSDRSMTQSSHSHNSNNSNGSDNRSHGSLDEEDIQLRAEAIITRLDLFADSINGFGDNAARINYTRPITVHAQSSTSHQDGQSEPIKTQHLRRLLSNPSMSQDDHSTSPPERHNREGGQSRIPGWSHWRERHNSHNGKTDVNDLGDVLIDCCAEGQDYPSESVQKDCEAWKASFGLFWVAAGHWLDDSRLINSYHLQPQDVLELQRRDHYIQLPPPGSNLSYYDHYAEGILFKLSKKNRPVSMFSNNNGKESTGVWKERWVVMQGSRLLIYHKRKDVNKKTIDLPTPLHLVTRTLPHSSRQMFKFTPSASAMSTTMISLDISPDPMVPKLCFRGSSEHDINHWIRIFNSLNSNMAPLASPIFHVGPGSPMTAGSDIGSLPNTLTGFSPERRRVQTASTAFSNDASTVPSINPVLISNAAAAISNLQSHQANNNNSNGSHSRNLGHANHLKGGPTLENKDLNLLHHHPLNINAKEDIRRRAVTEPNRHRLMNPQQQRGHTKHPSKVSAPEIDTKAMVPVDVSNVSEAPFRLDSPPGRKRRPVLGTEYLDNASQVLLATSSARSSTAPVYSGYVWLYIPQHKDAQETDLGDRQLANNADSPDASTKGSPVSQASTSNKASGRYVKCFAAINDQGHFQWVEVKKQNDLGHEQDVKADIKGSSRSSYGIQLVPPQRHTESPVHRHAENSPDGAEMAPPTSAESVKKSTDLIQASMSNKLRLYFFCIKVSPSALKEVLISMVPENPSPTASPPTVILEHVPAVASASNGAAKVASKVRHRLSSSLSTLTTSAKPPLPNVKSQSHSGSISKGKNATWPTIVPFVDKDGSLLHPSTAPGSSSYRSMSHKASSASLKSTLTGITTVPPPNSSSWLQSKDGDGQMVQSPASASSPDPESPSSSTSSSSNVLTLAQGLQKAARLTRSHSGSDALVGVGHAGYDGEALGSRSVGSSPNGSGARPKMTLSEVMAAKQASIPDSAATLEQSKLLQQQIDLQQGQQSVDGRWTRSMDQNQLHQPLQEPVNLEPSRPTSEAIRATCPFLELSRDNDDIDADQQPMITLKGYTETEEGWKFLQWALEKFLDEPIQEHNSALPPDDTLIPSYNLPPEIQLSEKANIFLSAKASLVEEAHLAASMAAVDAVRSPTPDMTRHDSGLPTTAAPFSVGGGGVTVVGPTATPVSTNGPVAQIRATSVSLTRWMNLSGGGDRDKNKKGVATHRAAPSASGVSFHAATSLPPGSGQHVNKQVHVVEAVGHSPPTYSNSKKLSAGGGSSSGAQSKRGLSATNVLSLSVGSGTSLFRPRPRLNQQRSADELSKALNQVKPDPVGFQVYPSDQQQQYAAGEHDHTTSLYCIRHPSDERGRGRSGSIVTGGGHYTTSAAMAHTTEYSTDELSSSSNGNNTNIGVTTSRPDSKGKTYCVDKDHQYMVANENSLSPPSSSGSGSGSGSGAAQRHSPHRGKVLGSTQSIPPNSNCKTGFITAISAAVATTISPPSSTSSSSSSSSSLTSKPQQTMAMSSGDQRDGARPGPGPGGGGEGEGGVLREIEDAAKRVASSHFLDGGYNSLAAADRPPPLPARPIGEVSPKDLTNRSSLYSLHGPEFLTVKAAEGQHFGGRNHNRTNSDSFNDKSKSSHNSNKNGGYGNNGGDGMLQLAEIGYDLGLSLSELVNPDGSLRTPTFVDSRHHHHQQQQQQQQKQDAPNAVTTSLSSSVPPRHGLGLGLSLGVGESQRGDMYLSPPPSFSTTMTHPLDPTGQPVLEHGLRNGGGEGGGSGSGSRGAGGVGGEGISSLGNKKHHTVLGASRAVVTGVFVKFRKSIG